MIFFPDTGTTMDFWHRFDVRHKKTEIIVYDNGVRLWVEGGMIGEVVHRGAFHGSVENLAELIRGYYEGRTYSRKLNCKSIVATFYSLLNVVVPGR